MDIKKREDFDKLIHLNLVEYGKVIMTLTEDELKSFKGYPDLLLKLEDKQFNFVFFRLPSNIKNILLENKDICQKVLKLPKTVIKRSVLSLLDDSNKDSIIERLENLEDLEDLYLDDLLNHISDNQFENLIERLKGDNRIYHNKIQVCGLDTEKYMHEHFDITDKNLISSISIKCKTGKINPYVLLKLQNEAQLFLLDRFSIAVYSPQAASDIFEQIPYDLLSKINAKDIRRTMNEISMRNEPCTEDLKLLLAVRLYSIFGLDNALKIINQKFSSVTISSLNRAGEIEFIDRRRKYRLEHQNEFYSYEILSKVKDAVVNKDVHELANITKLDYEELKQSIDELKQKYENDSYGIEFLSQWLKNTIKDREDSIKEIYIGNFIQKNNQRLGRNQIPYQKLNEYFENVDLTKFSFDQAGKVIVNKNLIKFLLGNTKVDNDCTLRLIFNQMALGLNDNLARVINQFKDIEKVIKKSSNMTIDSILDVIDVNKVLLYELAPNEQGISLETITRIYNSHKFCTESPEEIMRRAKELYHNQKYKISSTIPLVSGNANGFRYQLINFQDDKLLTCGIETGSCFKIGGKGEDFLKYCVLNPNGAVISLKNNKGQEYICQIVRKGNTIYANGIDPKESNEEKNTNLMKALEEVFSQMALLSKDYQPIELAVITNLDRENFFEKSNYLQRNITFVEKFYSDLGKTDKKFYTLFQSSENVVENHYEADDIYRKDRSPIYECLTSEEEDKERLELVLNDITYDSIQFKDISQKEKNSRKRRYKSVHLDDYKYVIGNTDWYIGITDSGFTACVLPYDKRATFEMRKVLNSKEFKEVLESIEEEKGKQL